MVGERAGRAVGNFGAGKDPVAGGEIGEGEVWEGTGGGGFRQNSGSVRVEETAGHRRGKGGGDDGDFGSEPPAVAGDAGSGLVLGEDVSGLAAGIPTEISEA